MNIENIDDEIKKSAIIIVKNKTIKQLKIDNELINYWQGEGDKYKNLLVMSDKFDELYRNNRESLCISYYDDIINCIHKINAVFYWKYNKETNSPEEKEIYPVYISYTQIHINRLQQQRNQLQYEEQQKQYKKQQKQYWGSLIVAIAIAIISFIFTYFSNKHTEDMNMQLYGKMDNLYSKMNIFNLSIKEIDNKIIFLIGKSDTISIKIKEMASDTLKNLSDKKCK